MFEYQSPSQLQPRLQRTGRSTVVRFLLSFVGLLASYYVAIAQPAADLHIMLPLLTATARVAGWAINLFGAASTVDGVIIRGSEYAMAVRRGCDPLDPIALFSAAVMAFPARWWQKLTGWLAGAITLFLVNVVRLASLYYIGAARSPYFATMHQEIWPAAFILLALGLWFIWQAWLQRTGTIETP